MRFWNSKPSEQEAKIAELEETIKQLRNLNQELYARVPAFVPGTKDTIAKFGEHTKVLVLQNNGRVIQATIKDGRLVNFKGQGIAQAVVRGLMIQPGVSNGLQR